MTYLIAKWEELIKKNEKYNSIGEDQHSKPRPESFMTQHLPIKHQDVRYHTYKKIDTKKSFYQNIQIKLTIENLLANII